MKRVIDIDKEFKAKNIEEAAKKFYDFLMKKGLEWVAEEMKESVENGYYCMSNAERMDIIKGKVTSPKTTDWTYYWAIEEVTDNNDWYAWFIERA